MATLRLAMAVDANNPIVGDIYLDANGHTRMTATLREEVQQLLWQRFSFFKGEWFLDPLAGVPWFQSILGVKNSDDIVAGILSRVITSCPGVAKINAFALNRTGRAAAPTFSCTLADGVVLTSADFPPFVLG